jgi:hypothetical protein
MNEKRGWAWLGAVLLVCAGCSGASGEAAAGASSCDTAAHDAGTSDARAQDDAGREAAPALGDAGDALPGEAGADSPSCVPGLPPRTNSLSVDCHATGPCQRCGSWAGTLFSCSGCTLPPIPGGSACTDPGVLGAGYPENYQLGQCVQSAPNEWCCEGSPACTPVGSGPYPAAYSQCQTALAQSTPQLWSCPIDRATGYATTPTGGLAGRQCLPGSTDLGTVAGSTSDAIVCCQGF